VKSQRYGTLLSRSDGDSGGIRLFENSIDVDKEKTELRAFPQLVRFNVVGNELRIYVCKQKQRSSDLATGAGRGRTDPGRTWSRTRDRLNPPGWGAVGTVVWKRPPDSRRQSVIECRPAI